MNNAVAGPSRPPSPPPMPISDSPPLFFPPPADKAPAVFFRSTQDLLATFALLDAYDKYVSPSPDKDDAEPTSPSSVDKGKGKERDVSGASPPLPPPQTLSGDPDDDDPGSGKGEKKRKNTYKHLIKGAPGKHSMKKDDYLITAMAGPAKTRIKIAPFDERTQEDAFTVTAEGLKGWNINALILESAKAREERKNRKAWRRKGNILHSQPQTPLPTPSAAAPTPSSPATASTPRPSVARTGSTKPLLPPVQVSGLPVSRIGTGTPRTATPHPLSAPPLSASALQTHQVMRGKKRERDEGPPTPLQPKAIVGAKASMAGVRPRPLKKQKTDAPGPIQQPTPQGV